MGIQIEERAGAKPTAEQATEANEIAAAFMTASDGKLHHSTYVALIMIMANVCNACGVSMEAFVHDVGLNADLFRKRGA
jgi:hypothetical protein